MPTYKRRIRDEDRRIYPVSMPMSWYKRIVAAAEQQSVTVGQWIRDAIADKLEDA